MQPVLTRVIDKEQRPIFKSINNISIQAHWNGKTTMAHTNHAMLFNAFFANVVTGVHDDAAAEGVAIKAMFKSA